MVKKLLITFLIAFSANAEDKFSETYLVHQFTPDVRIVLSTTLNCDPKDGKGKRAAAQRIDNVHIKGCWKVDPTNKDNIRVDWVGTNDFYIERADKFTKVTEK